MLRWPKNLRHNPPYLPFISEFSSQSLVPEQMSPITPYLPATIATATIASKKKGKEKNLKIFNPPVNSARVSIKPFLLSPTAMFRLRVILLLSISFFLCIASLSSTAPTPLARRGNTDNLSSGSCDRPVQRKEWYFSLYSQASLKHLQLINYRRTLGPDEKKGYIDAILCLQALPAALSSTIPGAVSRFDDFVGLHISQMEKVHLNVCLLASVV